MTTVLALKKHAWDNIRVSSSKNRVYRVQRSEESTSTTLHSLASDHSDLGQVTICNYLPVCDRRPVANKTSNVATDDGHYSLGE